MKVKASPDLNLFVFFLAINSAGYSYENNPNGIHPIRKQFLNKGLELAGRPHEFKDLIDSIINTKIKPNEYIRFANLIINSKKNFDDFESTLEDASAVNSYKSIMPLFRKIVRQSTVNKLFKLYIKYCNEIPDYNVSNIKNELKKVILFFNFDKNISLNINIHLNLLDSYNRGTNYFQTKNQTISCSLTNDNKLNIGTIRHEFMHVLLKKIFKDDLRNSNLILPVNENYAMDDLRVKFEENFIYAANLFFIESEEERNNNLKYFYDRGYKRIYRFYDLIRKHFVAEKRKLSDKNLVAFLGEL